MTEEIKSQLDYFKDEPKYLRKVIDELEQENKTLKANASVIQEYITKNEQLKTNIDSLAKKCCKYRSALEEIRILATKNVSIENFVKIQNKINEVLQ